MGVVGSASSVPVVEPLNLLRFCDSASAMLIFIAVSLFRVREKGPFPLHKSAADAAGNRINKLRRKKPSLDDPLRPIGYLTNFSNPSCRRSRFTPPLSEISSPLSWTTLLVMMRQVDRGCQIIIYGINLNKITKEGTRIFKTVIHVDHCSVMR
jgi:hypothetical protein